jgi:hypothetical protein
MSTQQQLTDDQLKEIALQNYKNEEVKSYNFPTETVPLPSKGLLYPKDHPLASGFIDLKYMTAREEDILTSSNLIKQGTVLDKLMQSLIVSPVRYDDIYVGDKNAIMIASRILGYGKDYEIEVEDPFSPGTKQQLTIDLQDITDKEIDWSLIPENENKFEFILPNSKRKITFRLLTHGIENQIAQDLKMKKLKKSDGIDREFTTRLKHIITSVDDETSRLYIDNFVDNELFSLDSRALRDHMKNVSPDVDLTFEFVSDVTGESLLMDIPLGTSFFWPRG